MAGTAWKEAYVAFDVGRVRQFAGVPVRVRLADGTAHDGTLRTELLSERSLSVYIAGAGDEGATLYIDQIESIIPLEMPSTK
jgi:hypothetical protein